LIGGAVAHYLLGYWWGEERLRRLIKRIERFKILSEADLENVSEMFDRHGGKAIVMAHLTPGIGSLISIPPGIKGTAICGRFQMYPLIGSTLWNVIFIALEWQVGSWWPLIEHYTGIIKYAVEAVIAVGIVWLIWRRWLSSLLLQDKSEAEISTQVP
jgi:membrane protein DedA with SNARE-associated domain